MIALAFAGPTPFRVSSSAAVAELRSTTAEAKPAKVISNSAKHAISIFFIDNLQSKLKLTKVTNNIHARSQGMIYRRFDLRAERLKFPKSSPCGQSDNIVEGWLFFLRYYFIPSVELKKPILYQSGRFRFPYPRLFFRLRHRLPASPHCHS